MAHSRWLQLASGRTRPPTEAAYLKRTPIRCAVRQATSQDRVRISGLTMSWKLSGIPNGLTTSRQAPVSDRFRIIQSVDAPAPGEIVPPLNVRCRGLVRCSALKCLRSKKMRLQPFSRSPLSGAEAQTQSRRGRSIAGILENHESGTCLIMLLPF